MDKCDVKTSFDAAAKPKLKSPKAPKLPRASKVAPALSVVGNSSGNSSVLAKGLVTGTPGASSIFPSGYGFVVLTAVGSIMMVTWKSMKVGIARDEFKVPYPQMYSSDNTAFNCVLRAHQNTLENYPQFLLLLMIGGYEMPYFCTLGGWIWILGRIFYAKGYYTGDPTKRARGTFSIIGMIMLLAATAKFALKHLRG
ncbi:unnamed protein product [Orchesella dallaii]|uniref:Microsomal glutathione S-transferase 3 n=1 Tax=Orchesella dallaii TaxID=48710 RepID=A0ABP1QFJ7_9HEXA